MITILRSNLYDYIDELKERAELFSREGMFGEAEQLWKVIGELEDILGK